MLKNEQFMQIKGNKNSAATLKVYFLLELSKICL